MSRIVQFYISSFVFLTLAPTLALANPVSFKDGWGIMPAYSPEWSDLDFNYSLDNKQAIGFSNFYREDQETISNYLIPRYNRLIKRWNELESQGNLYLSLGTGLRHDSKENESLAAYAAFEANWETRRIYTLFSAETLQSKDDIASNRIRGRLGFAPYLAPVDQINTWVVMQLDHMPEMQDENEVTPLFRFFYMNYALELGVSLNGKGYFAVMAHF